MINLLFIVLAAILLVKALSVLLETNCARGRTNTIYLILGLLCLMIGLFVRFNFPRVLTW